VIDAPEVDQQLAQSLSNLNTAKRISRSPTSLRIGYRGLIKTMPFASRTLTMQLVVQRNRRICMKAIEAKRQTKLQALQSFERIYAPFGVVTARTRYRTPDRFRAAAGGVENRHCFTWCKPGTLRVYVKRAGGIFERASKSGMTAISTSRNFPDAISREACPQCRRHQLTTRTFAD